MGKSYEGSESSSEISFISNRKIPSYIGSSTLSPFIKPIVSRNWINSKSAINNEDVMNLKNIQKKNLGINEIENIEEILENTYESIDHPKFLKNMNNQVEKSKKNRISFDLEEDAVEDEEQKEKEEKVLLSSPAGIFENITKQSNIFLTGSLNNCPIVRLQKTVIRPVIRPVFSNPDTTASRQKVVIEPLLLPDDINLTESCMSEQFDFNVNNRPDTASTIDTTVSENNPSMSENNTLMSENNQPSTSDSGQNTDSQTLQDVKHEELLQKIALLQRVVDDLKLKHPEKYGDVGKDHTALPQGVQLADEDHILINKLKAEQIRNKERIRNREKARHERQRKSVELNDKRCQSAKDDRSDSTTNDESKPSSYAGSRNKLSKKKEIWKKNPKKRNSLMESSGTDLSALSGDDDDKIVPSDYTEQSLSHYDRIPPLQPHPPYSNHMIPTAALFHSFQLPYTPYPLPPPQMMNNMNTNMNTLPHGSNVIPQQTNTSPNNVITVPKLNNLEIKVANVEPSVMNATNIVLPSGRGKARGNQRIVSNGDLEKLEEAQEKARTKLKEFIDRADSGELMVTCSNTSCSSSTITDL